MGAMKIVSAAEMREIDRVTAEQHGVPSLTLMENAGTAVAEFVAHEYPWARNLLVLCGKGNNGGDGFVAARRLYESGRSVRVLLFGEPGEIMGDAGAMFARLPVKAEAVRSMEELDTAWFAGGAPDVVVDAVLGTGFRPPASELVGAAIAQMRASNAAIVAVDLPSGANADARSNSEAGEFAAADVVVTFTAPRPAHVFARLVKPGGRVLVRGIGSPEEAVRSELGLAVVTAREVKAYLDSVERADDSHKGDYGHLLVVGGSVGKAGAAAMCGMGALRAGTGLVTVACPKSVLPTVAGFVPELMTKPLAETAAGAISVKDLQRVAQYLRAHDVVAVGPGLSRDSEAAQFARTVVEEAEVPVVLDADGLNAFVSQTRFLDGRARPLILTPHPGEMARLMAMSMEEIQRDRVRAAREFAAAYHVIVVLKGHRTVIAAPGAEAAWVNPTGNPGMATGGTGDVLAGIIAGLVAQTWKRTQAVDAILRAVLAAVWLHGAAGDAAAQEIGMRPLIATDLLGALPGAFRRPQAELEEGSIRL